MSWDVNGPPRVGVVGGSRSDFQRGYITWSEATNTTTVTEGPTK